MPRQAVIVVRDVKQHTTKICSDSVFFSLEGCSARKNAESTWQDAVKLRPADCQETVSALGDHCANCDLAEGI